MVAESLRVPAGHFFDALASVRRKLWADEGFCTSTRDQEMVDVPRAFVKRLTDTLCYAA